MSRFRFVEDHRDTHEVKRLCRLAESSRSGYHQWRLYPPRTRPRAVADAELTAEIVEIHQVSKSTYGRPPIAGQLRRRGRRVNHERVTRLMRRAGICGLSNRRRWRCSGANRLPAPAGDLVGRDFTATAPNQRWVADLTEFVTDEGRLYLAGVVDLYARRCVGSAMSERHNAELVVDALAWPSHGVNHPPVSCTTPTADRWGVPRRSPQASRAANAFARRCWSSRILAPDSVWVLGSNQGSVK
jgi:hypothetical protein